MPCGAPRRRCLSAGSVDIPVKIIEGNDTLATLMRIANALESTGTSAAGGAGIYGAGGGGSGAADANSGAGGAGGTGLVVIISEY